ncbi:carbon storage regulator CsrA [Heyndrickxia oleronia]|uniref:Translational regulator CsrA n=1 Tax=Heyndrickxia oleronia TaxID=38875 RepID=A0A8E2LEA5_9BACI|nr:carbon storage regulator CsrA [Heyndrickxia oleronia]MEC1377395.1 carbon storage regulator CsrA [Heyndrickxia oleronia]OOP67537.1 carbon storage regulator [Heyndrickxia oleronia]QQZ06034.1 carbon storage regulator CsrA [Heyndrickxia oleronia]
MLVLSRKKGESIQIGEDIEIQVVSIQGDQIKIGITAPRSIEIHRKEVYQEIQSENTSAARGITDLLKIIPKTNKQ